MPTTHSCGALAVGRRAARRARASSSAQASRQAMSSANSASSVTARGDHGQRRLLVAVERDQPLHHQLAHDAQRIGHVVAACAQGRVGLAIVRAQRLAGRQQRELGRIAAAQALDEARIAGQRAATDRGGADARCVGSGGTRLGAGGHNSCHSAILNERHDVFPFTSAQDHRCDGALVVGFADRLHGCCSRCQSLSYTAGLCRESATTVPRWKRRPARRMGVPVRIGSITARSRAACSRPSSCATWCCTDAAGPRGAAPARAWWPACRRARSGT